MSIMSQLKSKEANSSGKCALCPPSLLLAWNMVMMAGVQVAILYHEDALRIEAIF